MKIKEAIEELKNQELNIDSKAGSQALKKAIKSLEKQLELSLVELYPYNLALAIFGTAFRHTSSYDGETSEELAQTLSIQGIETVLKTLTDREQLVLEYRFKDRQTLEQVGKLLDLTRERVRQIEAKALRKLRHPSRLAKMKAYSYEDMIKNNEKITELEEENKLLKKATRMYISKEITREKLEKLAVSASIYDVRLEELDLSVRSYNCLKRRRINNLGELSKMTYEELSLVRNLGRKSLEEVLDKLKEFKIELKKGEQK